MFDLSQRVLEDILEAISRSLCCTVTLSVARASETGESSPILRVVLSRAGSSAHESAAVRVYLEGHPSAGDSNVAKEFEVLRAAAAGGVPVASPIGHGTAEAGGRRVKWLVTSWVEGQVPDPFDRAARAQVRELGDHPEFRRQFVGTLARIHSLPLPDLSLPDATPIAMARRELKRWRDVLDGAGFLRSDPVAAYAAAWLERMLPVLEGRTTTRFHGDYRLGNLIVRDRRIAAVLDWEFCGVGDGLYDLAWLVSPPAQVHGLASGVISRTELVDAYEHEIGSGVDRHCLQVLAVLATFKTMATWVKLALVSSEVPGANAWRLRRITSALRVRHELLTPIFAGPGRFLESTSTCVSPVGPLAAVANEAAPVSGTETSLRAVSVLRSILRHMSDQGEVEAVLDLRSSTARYLHAARGDTGSAESPGVALARAFTAGRDGSEPKTYMADGPEDAECRSLLRDWSTFPAALIGCGYGFWIPAPPDVSSNKAVPHG
jgi:aminoglycoside phosphotransferase (APT) family kinase protein